MKRNSPTTEIILTSLYRGSINRTQWWIGWLIIRVFETLISEFLMQGTHDVGALLLFVIAIAAEASIDIRRLHDLKVSGWWFVAFQIPGINIVRLIVLGLLPSRKV